jgi:hypothetical protein
LIIVICGALDVGLMSTTWFGIATDCAHRNRRARRHLSDDHADVIRLHELRRRLDRRCACVCPSSEATSLTDIFRAASAASASALSMLHGQLDSAIEIRSIGREPP